MKNEKRLDESFRKGLPSVEIPPAPDQDWAALARAAKQGARAAAVRDSGSLVSGRWLKLLGGASAILAAWYLAFGPQAEPHTPAKAAASTDTPAAHAGFIGGAPTDLIGLADAQHENDPSETASAPATVVVDERIREKAKAQRPVGSNKEQNDRDAIHGNRPESGIGTRGSAARRMERSSAAKAGNEQHLTDPTRLQPLVNTTLLADPAGTTAQNSPVTTTGPTGQGSDEEMQVLRVIPPLPSALSYVPNTSSAQTNSATVPFPHWSIAPWFSLGHSTWTDPEHAESSAQEELTIGREKPASFGLRIQYAFDDRLAMITGIQYARKGSLRGTVRSSSFLTTDYALSGDYLEVPLSLKFSLPFENKELYVRAGGLLQFNMHGGTDKVVMNDESRKELSTLVLARGSMGTALDIGVGVQFRLGRRLSLFIEPSYQYALSPAVKHPSFDKLPFNPRINTFSLATGLSFQFP